MKTLATRWGMGMLILLLAVVGCSKKAPPKAEASVPEVFVVHPYKDMKFVEKEEFTGYLKAVMTEQIRARVTGYLLAPEESGIPFKDGADVKKGQALFKIDPRTYQAEYDKAAASVRQAEATVTRLSGDLERARRAGRAASPEEVARLVGTNLEADAAVRAAKAVLQSARLNVDFTTVKSPIDGRLSNQSVDPGNLIKADDTILTTVVSLDPIYAYFDVDERTVLAIRERIRKNEIESARRTSIMVDIGLANETGFSRRGRIDFIDNQLDPGTGTLRVRAVVPNPPPKDISTGKAGKTNLLSPGMFVRVRVPIGKPHPELLVPEDALGSDQGERYIYVVVKDKDGKDIARQHKVTVGQQVIFRDSDDKEISMRVVRHAKGRDPGKGMTKAKPYHLSTESRVIVAGQQRVKPGKEVNAVLRTEPITVRTTSAK